MGKEQERADLHRTIWTVNMKKLFALVILCFAVLFAGAQTQHLKFMGISMDKTKTDFVSQLKAKGFTIAKEEALSTWMEGTFAREKVMLEISETGQTHKVFNVLVKFDVSTGYSFELLTSKLIEKYGYDVLTFDNPFVKDEKEHVAWIVDKNEQGDGNVIAVCKDNYGMLFVSYVDYVNYEQYSEETLNDF